MHWLYRCLYSFTVHYIHTVVVVASGACTLFEPVSPPGSVRAGLESGDILSALEVSRGVSTLANNAIHLNMLDERVNHVELGELVMQVRVCHTPRVTCHTRTHFSRPLHTPTGSVWQSGGSEAAVQGAEDLPVRACSHHHQASP